MATDDLQECLTAAAVDDTITNIFLYSLGNSIMAKEDARRAEEARRIAEEARKAALAAKKEKTNKGTNSTGPKKSADKE